MSENETDMKLRSDKHTVWASLGVCLSILAGFIHGSYPVFAAVLKTREQIEVDPELPWKGAFLYLPSALCLLISNYLSWSVVLAILERVLPHGALTRTGDRSGGGDQAQ